MIEQMIEKILDEYEANVTITNGESVKLATIHVQEKVIPAYNAQKTENEIIALYNDLSNEDLYKLAVGLKNLQYYASTHYLVAAATFADRMHEEAKKRLAEAEAVAQTGT